MMMKLVWVVYAGSHPSRVGQALTDAGAPGWTRLDHAHGAGTHGRIDGTRAWPGEEIVHFAFVPTERLAEVSAALGALQQGHAAGERLHFAVLPVEHFQ